MPAARLRRTDEWGAVAGQRKVKARIAAKNGKGMFALPLQLIDQFLIQYNVGQVLLLVFVLSVLATLPLKSQRLIALVTIAFGLVFLMTPASLQSPAFLFLGIGLLVVGPMVYITANG